MEFLSARHAHLEFGDYDRRILFLILASDPDFLMHDIFLDTEIISESTIKQAPEEDKEKLKEKRKRQLSEFRDKVKSKLGFYDTNFLAYESDLRKIIDKDKLIFNVKYDALSRILERAQGVTIFDKITEEDLERLKLASERWLIEAENLKDFNSLAYNLLIKPGLFNIKNIPEQVLIFIMLADPELNMLRIYEEESREVFTKERCLEEVGFYDSHLIQLERKYHDKFLPDMRISIWDK